MSISTITLILPTCITKLIPASACHAVASCSFLDPEFAFLTSFILFTLNKFHELFIIFVETVVDSVFSTGLALVIGCFTI